MTRDRDDEALSWGEPEDPSYLDPARADDASGDAGGAPGADAAAATTATAATTAPGASRDELAAQRRRTALAATTGVLGGIYLMYTVGWVIGATQLPLTGVDLVQEISYQFAEFLAIIAPLVWFVATLVTTRERGAAHRIGWLAVGSLVLLPWPFLLGVLS